MGCACRKRRMATTSANINTGEQPASSEQVEAIVAGAANTATDREQPAGETTPTR